MNKVFGLLRKVWMSCLYGKMLRKSREQESSTAMPLPVRQPVPMGFAPLSNKTVIRDTRRRRHSFMFGAGVIDTILMRDDVSAQRAALTLATAKANRGQWHRATRVPA